MGDKLYDLGKGTLYIMMEDGSTIPVSGAIEVGHTIEEPSEIGMFDGPVRRITNEEISITCTIPDARLLRYLLVSKIEEIRRRRNHVRRWRRF